MRYEYDQETDAVFIRFDDKLRFPPILTEEIDDTRSIDYNKDGDIIGIKFLNIASGVDTSDLPRGDEVVAILGANDVWMHGVNDERTEDEQKNFERVAETAGVPTVSDTGAD